MFRLTRSQVLPIGLDIGRCALKMIQLEVVDDDLVVHAAAREEFPPEARSDAALRMSLAAPMVRKLLRTGGFSGRRAAVALPREIVHMKNFRLPLMPAVELDGAVALEASNLFPGGMEEAQFQHVAAGEVRQGNDVVQELIVFGARNDEVNGFVEQVHQCGLLIDSLDIEPCALYRAVERFIRRREDEQEVHVLVDVGLTGTQIVVGRGREMSFVKSIELGGLHLHQAVSRRLGVGLAEAQALRRRLADEAEGEQKNPVRQAVFDATRSTMEQLAREIALCLRYYSVTFRGQRPMRVRLSGGEAGDAQFQSVLQSVLGMPVEAASPMFSVDIRRMKSSERRGTLSEWAVAMGLALRRTTRHYGARDGRSRKAGSLPRAEEAAGAGAAATAAATAASIAAAAPVVSAPAAAVAAPTPAGVETSGTETLVLPAMEEGADAGA